MPRRGFREVLRKGRRDLHDQLQVAALYIAFDGAAPIPVTVRDHTRVIETGDEGSRAKGYAQMVEIEARLVFLRAELDDARNGAIFSLSPGEAYRVERTDRANDITRTAYVSPLSAAEAAGLPVPVLVAE